MARRDRRVRVRVRLAEEREQAATVVAEPEHNERGQFVSPGEETVTNGDSPVVDDRVGEELLRNIVLTPDEVSRLLRIDEDDLMDLARKGILPAMKIHRKTRFLRRDVITYMREVRHGNLGRAAWNRNQEPSHASSD